MADHFVVGPDEEDNERLGELLEELRLNAGLSRARAAEAIGVSSEYIRLIEHGKRTPANGQMRRMLTTYDKKYTVGTRRLTFDGITVEFTGRIRKEHLSGDSPHRSERLSQRRSERLGQIVSLLVIADDKTLNQVYKLLAFA